MKDMKKIISLIVLSAAFVLGFGSVYGQGPFCIESRPLCNNPRETAQCLPSEYGRYFGIWDCPDSGIKPGAGCFRDLHGQLVCPPGGVSRSAQGQWRTPLQSLWSRFIVRQRPSAMSGQSLWSRFFTQRATAPTGLRGQTSIDTRTPDPPNTPIILLPGYCRHGSDCYDPNRPVCYLEICRKGSMSSTVQSLEDQCLARNNRVRICSDKVKQCSSGTSCVSGKCQAVIYEDGEDGCANVVCAEPPNASGVCPI